MNIFQIFEIQMFIPIFENQTLWCVYRLDYEKVHQILIFIYTETFQKTVNRARNAWTCWTQTDKSKLSNLSDSNIMILFWID